MQSVDNNNFGVLIAHLVPGFTAVLGLSLYSETVTNLLATECENAPTIGGVLYLSILAVAAGMTVGAIRWATIDTLHRITGLKRPELRFQGLKESAAGVTLLIEIHYRYYLFYSNILVAMAFSYICFKTQSQGLFHRLDLAFLLLAPVFFAASRDALRNYYQRLNQLLSV